MLLPGRPAQPFGHMVGRDALLGQEIADDLRSALSPIQDVLGDLEQRVQGAPRIDATRSRLHVRALHSP